MHGFRRDKKEEEDGHGGHSLLNLDKSSVLQEARATFNGTPVVARKCSHVLTKILMVLNQGEAIGKEEATETFFAITKLFQSRDQAVRRLVYVCIKDMASISNDVIIVTSSLTKDMTGKEDEWRAPAIRALCRITDAQMLQSIERLMKQAMVDKTPQVASAALTSSVHVARTNPEVVRRWLNEATEAASSGSDGLVQYHAIGLLYAARKHDKLAVRKLVSKHSRSANRSPLACCLLIRIAAKALEEDDTVPNSGEMMEFIEGCLRHKSEMVIYEAARSLVGLNATNPKELAPAVSVLQLFCSSPKPTLRLAAVRTLSAAAAIQPAAVSACNLDLENLMSDGNRSVATLAMSTLLKTGGESSVERLVKQISSFMADIGDELKVEVVRAVRSLCEKFPRKASTLSATLAQMLRDEGGVEYKSALVDALIAVLHDDTDARNAALSHLCEFIEDCEHTSLATRVLHVLGREGPKTARPAAFIRYIYNRVILEAAAVRAAAVTALAQFGAHCPDLLPSILVLLRRCALDQDDEVRDRATLYIAIFQSEDQSLISSFISGEMHYSVPSLEKTLRNYLKTSCADNFNMKTVPIATPQEQGITSPVSGGPTASEPVVAKAKATVKEDPLEKIPELAKYSPVFKSSGPLALTEALTEYTVECTKHITGSHVVLQFRCENTLADQLLENVWVQVEGDLETVELIDIKELKCGSPASCYTVVELPDFENMSSTFNLACTLKFKVRDCDPTTGEADDGSYDDDYVLEDAEITVADHIQKVLKADWAAAWEELGPQNELEDTFALSSMNTLQEAVKQIHSFLGMQACERSDNVPEGKSAHVLLLAGVFRGGHAVLVRARLALSNGVTMKLSVRSTDSRVSNLITQSVG